jgi:hypothetical protein
MEQSTYDELQLLRGTSRAYLEAIALLQQASGIIDSTPGTGDGLRDINKAIMALDRRRRPVVEKISALVEQSNATLPKREGFRGMG